jgi:hypothetical protein
VICGRLSNNVTEACLLLVHALVLRTGTQICL